MTAAHLHVNRQPVDPSNPVPVSIAAIKRKDADTADVNNGEPSGLQTDEAGRLKVAAQPASYSTVAGNITNATLNNPASYLALNVERISNLVISMAASGLGGHNATFEYSNNSTDGANGNWYQVQVVRTNANTIETTTGVLAATPVYGWELSVNAYKWFRVRATAHTSGTAAYTIQPGSYATEPIPAAQLTGTQPVSMAALPAIVGQGADSAAAAGNSVRGAGRVFVAVDTTLAANDQADLGITSGRQLVIKPFAPPEVDWFYAAPAGGILNTTAVVLKGAVAGQRNYLTRLDLKNAHASTASEIVVLDGSTVIWREHFSAGQLDVFQFDTPLKSSVNAALNLQVLTASQIYPNAAGYAAL
jgi:hypothetical protein